MTSARAILYCLCGLLSVSACAQIPAEQWDQMKTILERISPPVFPAKDFVITDFGARGDGKADCSDAIRKAIAECSKSGGGRVVVPEGVFVTGPIHLVSNINLHVSSGATLRFVNDPQRYMPPVFTRWEGVECMNYSPLIYAFEQENIAVTGGGTLDGQADNEHWWFWKGNKDHGWKEGMPNQLADRKKLFAMGETNVPVEERVFGVGSYLRPSFIQPYRCKNILIDSIKIINSPMWEIHPVLSSNITVQNVTIDTHGPNNDGCNPESSKDVLIRNCSFDTGDDCIAIKSGRNNDGRRVAVPSENIVIQDCSFKDGHGGITIGSEISGGVRNVFAERCDVESPVLYNTLRIKSNAVRGGTIENVFLRDIEVRLVERAAIDIDLFYEEGKNGNFLPKIRGISVERMNVKACKAAFNFVGYEEAPLRNITLKDCNFQGVTNGYTVKHVDGFNAVNTTVNGEVVKK